MSEDLNKMKQIVWQNAALQKELQEISDREEFIARLVEIGRARGLRFGEEDVSEAMRDGRRVWIERWL